MIKRCKICDSPCPHYSDLCDTCKYIEDACDYEEKMLYDAEQEELENEDDA